MITKWPISVNSSPSAETVIGPNNPHYFSQQNMCDILSPLPGKYPTRSSILPVPSLQIDGTRFIRKKDEAQGFVFQKRKY